MNIIKFFTGKFNLLKLSLFAYGKMILFVSLSSPIVYDYGPGPILSVFYLYL